MKQILAFALAILLCFCAFSGCEKQEKPGANSTDFTFKLNDNGNGYALAAYSGTDVNVIIPNSYEGLPVTEIYTNAFYQNPTVKSITVPGTITEITSYTFSGCVALETVSFQDGVTTLGQSIFSGCVNLTEINLPQTIASIDPFTFMDYAALVNINLNRDNPYYHLSGNCLIETASRTLMVTCSNSMIPSDGSVTKIAPYAFYNREWLTSIELPDSIVSIGDHAFVDCYNLKEIIVGSGVTEISGMPFDRCQQLETVYYKGAQDALSNLGGINFCIGYQSVSSPDGSSVMQLVAPNIYCYSETEQADCWRYVNGVPTPW